MNDHELREENAARAKGWPRHDNDSSPLAEGMRGMMLAKGLNIAANGRWGMLGMAAIALQQDLPIIAFLFVLLLLAAYIAEQLPASLRHFAAFMLAAWGAVLALVFFGILLWL